MLFLSNFTLVCQLRAQTNGQLIQPTIPAPSITNNILDAPTKQKIVIYLPPSYNSSTKTYPVIYFLTGFSTSVTDFINGSFQGFILQNTMDQLIQAGTISEMIVVVVRAGTFIGGAFYVNSSVSGNWEDFIVNDVVSYVDNNYRTLAVAKYRGIAGHSMGGFGALHLAMHHPDIFGSVYALSPGLFDQNGLSNCQLFKSQSFINQFLTKEAEYAAMQPTNALPVFKTYIAQCYSASDDDTPFAYAYGAAFSPNPNNPVPYTNYPYYKSGNSVLVYSTILQNYENGFGGWSKKIETYKENFLKLSAITVDYGTSDYYVWIPQGCVYFSSLLTQAKIPHMLVSFAGGHSDKLGERIEQYMLPSLSKAFDFGPPSSYTIYPGDANNDGIVDARDILPIGRYFGLTGPSRAGGILTQTLAQHWTPAEVCYADCDGNGIINAKDVQGIVNNWFLTHTMSANLNINRIEVCKELLSEIDRQQPLSNGMKEVRNEVLSIIKSESLGVFDYALDQNWPNPFNPSTTIRFTVPEEVATVRLEIINLLGQQEWSQTLSNVSPGTHEIEWFGKTETGSTVASGVYFYRLSAGSFTSIKRMLIIK